VVAPHPPCPRLLACLLSLSRLSTLSRIVSNSLCVVVLTCGVFAVNFCRLRTVRATCAQPAKRRRVGAVDGGADGWRRTRTDTGHTQTHTTQGDREQRQTQASAGRLGLRLLPSSSGPFAGCARLCRTSARRDVRRVMRWQGAQKVCASRMRMFIFPPPRSACAPASVCVGLSSRAHPLCALLRWAVATLLPPLTALKSPGEHGAHLGDDVVH
jgi:hypothetical protein